MLEQKQNVFKYIKTHGVVYESQLILEFAKSDLPSKQTEIRMIIGELLYSNKIKCIGDNLLVYSNRKFYA